MLEILEEQMVVVAKEAECLGVCRHKSGSFSIFDPEIGYVVITPSGVARDVLGTEHVCVMDLWGKVVERVVEVKPPSEAMVYLYVYKERKDAWVIVHTHTRHSAAFSIMNKPIIPIVYECAYLGKTGTVPVAPYGRAGTVSLAWKVAEVMREYDCCLMENRGTITADRGMDAVFLKAQYVEGIVEMYYITLAAGNGAEPHALPVEGLQKWAYPKEIILREDRKMKKIISTPEHYTGDMLYGIYAAYPDMVEYVEDDLCCYCTAKRKQGKMAIITGGGIGHLPLFLGYVGENLLDGCGVGGVLQLPSPEQIYNVAEETEAGARVLFLYGNYTGDIMSFDTVTEMLDMDDIKTAGIVGANDVLFNKGAQARRGVTGVSFMHKCAGTRVARIGTLEEVLTTAERVRENTRAVDFTLTPCVIPGIDHSNLTLIEDEMTFGMGIRDEPGVWNGPTKTADGLIGESMGEILADMSLNLSEEVCVLINGLGTTSQEELYVLSGSVHRLLEEKGIRVHRTFVGEYTTSMEIAGTSISICRMADREMKQWIDMPVRTPLYTQV